MAIESTKTGASGIVQSMQMGSGINVQELAKNLAEAEAQSRIERVTNKKTAVEKSISGYAAASAAVGGMKSLFQLIKDRDILAQSVVSSSSSAVTVTDVGTLLPDKSYSLTVGQLARSQVSSLALSDIEDISALSSVSIAGNDFNIVQGQDAEALVTAINAADLGIRAALMNRRTDAGADSWVLTLQGESGLTNAFAVSALDANAGAVTVSTEQTALDAVVQVNGLTVYRAENDFADVIEGVKVDISNATVGQSYLLERKTDYSVVKNAIIEFVATYNETVDQLDLLGNKGEGEDENALAGALVSDRSLISSLKTALARVVDKESATASGGYGSLRDLGVSFGVGGKLELRESVLDAAIANDYEDIVTMLTADQNGQTKYAPEANRGLMLQLTVDLDQLIGKEGLISVRSKSADSRKEDFAAELEKLEERLQKSYTRYLEQFSAMESFVQQSKDMRSYLEGQFKMMQSTGD